jgi:hypothetical protein
MTDFVEDEMTESLFYYFLAFNLAVVFVMACGIIASDRRNKRELRKWERTRAMTAEVMGLQDHNSTAQPDSTELQDCDSSEEFDEHALARVQRFQRELNQQVIDLEKER